jgi:hypothetical protein
MYSSADYSYRHQPHPLPRSDRWSDACGNALGEAGAAAVTAITRVVQLPFVAAAFILGEITDSFLRASDNVGDAVGREAGRFAGRIVGTAASSVLSVIEAGGSMLYNAAHDAFTYAINCARRIF